MRTSHRRPRGAATRGQSAGLAVSVREMLEALRQVGGEAAVQRVRFAPDERIARIVYGWPARFDAARALALGFTAIPMSNRSCARMRGSMCDDDEEDRTRKAQGLKIANALRQSGPRFDTSAPADRRVQRERDPCRRAGTVRGQVAGRSAAAASRAVTAAQAAAERTGRAIAAHRIEDGGGRTMSVITTASGCSMRRCASVPAPRRVPGRMSSCTTRAG